MKKRIVLIALSFLVQWMTLAPVIATAHPVHPLKTVSRIATAPDSSQHNQQKPTPAYAKWGRLAMEEAKRRYPTAKIIDYWHVGRQVVSPQQTTETFKLWLRDSRREFGLVVNISFHPITEKVARIVCRETVR